MVAVAVEPFFTTYTNSYIKEKKLKHLRENIQDFNYLGEMKEKSNFSWKKGTPQFMHFISQGQMQGADNAEY